MSKIRYSVGLHGENIKIDVILIQQLLNKKNSFLKPLLPLKIDGCCGPLTIGFIKEYQRRIMGHKRPDGLIEVDGKTFNSLISFKTPAIQTVTPKTFNLATTQVLRSFSPSPAFSGYSSKIHPLTERDFELAAIELGVEIAALKAIAHVESKGEGFSSDGKPKILFEGHKFHEYTKGKYSKDYPSISYLRWDKSKYSKGANSSIRNAKEHARLSLARTLDEEAALKATSWGKFQIMGFNFRNVGWTDITCFARDMETSEALHLKAFIGFIKYRQLNTAIKLKDWKSFAKGYNGTLYHLNAYDKKIAAAYEGFTQK